MKKQLNYKSLNTLGDVDITQSVVPGGGEGTESGDWHYFDVSALEPLSKKNVLQIGMLFKLQGENIESMFGSSVIATLGLGYRIPEDITEEIKAVATDFTQKMQFGEQIITIEQFITNAPWYGQVPEITKEQFYKLPAALKIYSYYEDTIAHQDEMKFTFDTLWAIWERDGVEGQELAITIPNADIASITEISNEGTFAFNITSMMGGTTTSDTDTVTYIEFNGQYGPQIRKVENLITGEITYEHYYAA